MAASFRRAVRSALADPAMNYRTLVDLLNSTGYDPQVIVENFPWQAFESSLADYRAGLAESFAQGVMTFGENIPHINLGTDAFSTSFARVNPDSLSYAASRSSSLITAISDETRTTIRNLVTKSQLTGIAPEQLAADIRNVIGLTPRYANAVTNYQAGLLSQGSSQAFAEKMSAKYADRLLTSRATTIARTETLTAQNLGKAAGVEAAIANGFVTPGGQKVWSAASDERVCDICEPLDGTSVDLDESFDSGTLYPPAHPNCRCSWAYLPPDISQGVDLSQIPEMAGETAAAAEPETLTPEEQYNAYLDDPTPEAFDALLANPDTAWQVNNLTPVPPLDSSPVGIHSDDLENWATHYLSRTNRLEQQRDWRTWTPEFLDWAKNRWEQDATRVGTPIPEDRLSNLSYVYMNETSLHPHPMVIGPRPRIFAFDGLTVSQKRTMIEFLAEKAVNFPLTTARITGYGSPKGLYPIIGKSDQPPDGVFAEVTFDGFDNTLGLVFNQMNSPATVTNRFVQSVVTGHLVSFPRDGMTNETFQRMILEHEYGHVMTVVLQHRLGDVTDLAAKLTPVIEPFYQEWQKKKYGPDTQLVKPLPPSFLPDFPNTFALFAKESLSAYSTKNIYEFLAEAWSDYARGTDPSPLATAIGEALTQLLADTGGL